MLDRSIVFSPQGAKTPGTIMTYLNWGCDPLAEECQSCLDAFCLVCMEEYKTRRRDEEGTGGARDEEDDAGEPDCDNCDLEKKPDCPRCRIVLDVCRDCPRNGTCEFRITG